MSNSNTVWLSQFSNLEYVNIYGIDASFSEIKDSVQFHKLEVQKVSQGLNDSDTQIYSTTLKKSVELKKNWFAGKQINEAEMPTKVFLKPNRKLPKTNEVIFRL